MNNNKISTEFFEKNSSKVGLSLSFKFIDAIIKLFKKTKLKFFNIKKIEDPIFLNTAILPIIKQEILKNDLFFYSEVLNFDLNRLKITKYVSHSDEKIVLELKYFETSFNLEILFDNNFTNYDYKEAIVNLFENLSTEGIVLFEFSQDTDNIEQIEKLVKQILNKYQIKINNQNIKLDNEKIQIIMFKQWQWPQTKKFKIGFEFEDQLGFFPISLEDFITNNDIAHFLSDYLSKNFAIKLENKVNYQTFFNHLQINEWRNLLNEKLSNSSLSIRGSKIEIKQNQIQLEEIDEQNIKLTPWTRIFKVKATYLPNNQTKIFLDVNFMFTIPIDYASIIEAFKLSIENLIIDATQFATTSDQLIKNAIVNKILLHLNKKIIINNKTYDFDLKNLKIESLYVFESLESSQLKIDLELFDNLINYEKIKIAFNIININKWLISNIFAFLKKFQKNSPFDLNNEIDVNKTWTYLMKLVTKKIQLQYFANTFLEKISWKDDNNLNLDNEIKEINFTVEPLPKVLKFIYKNDESDILTIYFKNLLITEDYRILNEERLSFLKEQKTSLIEQYPLWKENENISLEQLGINYKLKNSAIKSQCKIKKVDDINGFIEVKISFEKNDAILTSKLIVSGFYRRESLVNKINNYFQQYFGYKIHNLSTRDLRKNSLAVFEKIFKLLLKQNYETFINKKLIDDGNSLIVNNREINGDLFKIELQTHWLKMALDFKLRDVKSGKILDFIENFATDQVTLLKNRYPSFQYKTNYSAETLGIKMPKIDPSLNVIYKIDLIDNHSGLIHLTCYVNENNDPNNIVKSDYITFLLRGFMSDEDMKNFISNYFKLPIPYEKHQFTTISSKVTAYSFVRDILKELLGQETFWSVAGSMKRVIDNRGEEMKNDDENNGDYIECILSFATIKSWTFRVNFKDVMHNDLHILKFVLSSFIKTQNTSKPQLDLSTLKIGEMINKELVGFEEPNRLIGCTVTYKIAKISQDIGELLVDAKISNGSFSENFNINVKGFKIK